MRLTAKTRNAVTAMLDLALYSDRGPRPLVAISRRLDVSVSYLEQLFAALRDAGLVAGTRGPGGGYCLNRDLDRISIADIICAVDDWVQYQQASGEQRRDRAGQTTARRIWNDLSQRIFDLTRSITLYELVSASEANRSSKAECKERTAIAEGAGLAALPKPPNA